MLFICTANTLDTIPGPLLDRMDVIQLAGYTEDEKLGIAKRYLVPKQLEAHGLTKKQLRIPDAVLRTVIREYTREAGVRNLERRIADLCRKAATQIAKGEAEKRPRRRRAAPRVARAAPLQRRGAQAHVGSRASRPGLAYTAVGGDVLFIEATAYPGKGKLTITGQLGEVMQESAQAALSWVRAHTEQLGAAGGLVRDARRPHPRAGGRGAEGRPVGRHHDGDRDRVARPQRARVSDDVGMTGEITLTGQVLPIGGIREKTLAAQRAGLKRVILPRENEPDLEELPARDARGARVRARRLGRRRFSRRRSKAGEHRRRRAPSANARRRGAPGGDVARLNSELPESGNLLTTEQLARKDGRIMAKTKRQVSGAASNVRPYVERAVGDEELRENVKAAFQAAREVYDELIGNRGVTTVATRVATDKDIQDKLREAVDELRTAADRVQGKKDHSGRNATLLIAGIALGILFNPVTGPGDAQVARGRRLRRRRLHVREPGRRRLGRAGLNRGLDLRHSRSPTGSNRRRAHRRPAATGASARRSEPGSSPLALEMSEI